MRAALPSEWIASLSPGPPEGAQAVSVFVLSIDRRKGKRMRVKYKERREKAMNPGRRKRRERQRQGRATERYGRKRGDR